MSQDEIACYGLNNPGRIRPGKHTHLATAYATDDAFTRLRTLSRGHSSKQSILLTPTITRYALEILLKC